MNSGIRLQQNLTELGSLAQGAHVSSDLTRRLNLDTSDPDSIKCLNLKAPSRTGQLVQLQLDILLFENLFDRLPRFKRCEIIRRASPKTIYRQMNKRRPVAHPSSLHVFLGLNLIALLWVARSVSQLSAGTALLRDQRLPPPAPTSKSTQCPGPVVSINAIHQEVVLDRIVILGERNSGTNAVEELFRRNLEGTFPIQAGLTEIKHYFQRWPVYGDAETARTLTIMVVRNPYDWLQSMHKMCYCCEDLCADNIPFESFLHKPFELSLEDPATHEKRPNEGCPVDVNIYDTTKRKFQHVLDARYQKALHFMNISRWSAGFEVVRWEDILDAMSQEIIFKKIAAKWRLRQKSNTFNALAGDVRFWKPTGNFNATQRRSSSMYLNPTRLGDDDPKVRATCNLINSKLDAYLEQILGYTVLQCSPV